MRTALACLAALATTAAADPCEFADLQRLDDPNPHENQVFGVEVAMDGEWVVVGASQDDLLGQDAGAAYVFRLVDGTAQFHQTLAPATLSPGDHFAEMIDIDGSTIAAVASGDDDAWDWAGAVYVYTLIDDQWTLTQKLTPEPSDPPKPWSWYAVSIDTPFLAIGAVPLSTALDQTDEPIGTVSIFRRDGTGLWIEETPPEPEGLTGRLGFGFPVALSRDKLAVGVYAPQESTQSSAVLIFDREDGAWHQEQRIDDPMPTQDSLFGYTMALRNNDLAISDPNYKGNDCQSGAVYVYRRNPTTGWNLKQTLLARDSLTGNAFGVSLSLAEHSILIGSFYSLATSVFHYTRTEGDWSLSGRITQRLSTGDVLFGFAIDHDGTLAVIGSPADELLADGSGAAFLVDLACLPTTCFGDRNADGIMNYDDLDDFINDYLAADPSADTDRDGDIDLIDVDHFAFLYRYYATWCPCP